MNTNLIKHHALRKIDTLVENRTVYSADFAELNIYETRQKAENVYLEFSYPIIASMISGKKIMHLNNVKQFDFVPGESVVLPANEKMIIDFPIASLEKPTECLALGIDASKIKETVELFNDKTRIEFENDQFDFDDIAIHLNHNTSLQSLVDRLAHTFVEGDKAKDVLIDLMIKELIIRLLQTKARVLLLNDSNALFDNSRMAFIVKYIREHLTEEISVDKLADKACMSKSSFFKTFKNTLGESPIDYLNAERIKFAKKLIRTSNDKLREVAFQAGFNNVSYFNRQFKKIEKITPKQYRSLLDNA
ncbi:AraC-type DNA-binding protein [Pustulibacterium marinum]|uniref:AraC-type DNA-binding protein n=1 Tax=Pustulibacterium marinum TaxID=1224947 RepID=A0A1I7FNQ9_9FLAO|nr:AraC family transcriptional regulator [Pustulibacterium marinum]SFU37842.1 AraC-type DNA-binding protein [Pustulibacterium marinum]